MFPLLLLPGLAAAAPAAAAAKAASLPMLPLAYSYGGYPKISTNISWGNPPQEPINTVVDLGSADFWVYGPNATINSGSPYFLTPGPCTEQPKPFFNYPESTSAAKPVDASRAYAYGGNGKIVEAHFSVNDTINFGNAKYPSLENQRVEVANYTILKQRAQTCTGAEYDKAILGISPRTEDGQGPSFRGDLLDRGLIETPSMSLWFDKGPEDVRGTYQGTALFGAVPKNKYEGDLVKVALDPPEEGGVGYWVTIPKWEVSSVKEPSKKTAVKVVTESNVKRCLVDSGFGTESLPVSAKDFYAATGLVEKDGFPTFEGPCDSIPKDATFDYTFTGEAGKPVTVKVPLRNYVRGISDFNSNNDPNVCGLSLTLEEYNCYIGAPFFTAAFLAFNDDANEMAIAQGGVSTGAEDGADGLSDVTIIKKGDKLPVSY
ncbi:uncharacterized protein K452DRAFT_284686 [Aplosporella prunicola CBS 121167]|uniref:Peptidase A1 domain-containing protein n=1 Tax=Aplosporella prunicola CBS 121167 TaxID=1176127 RepID=A0A6A6BJP2_9PEZI|nr:uncharacterized protein K452DRAFT_284686 [Aplosporella prunicola CBS 121167]KAF2144369.1 hypothetical protein K452DRAFT_284686 [Aplosporella prunicola CBS 121167]